MHFFSVDFAQRSCGARAAYAPRWISAYAALGSRLRACAALARMEAGGEIPAYAGMTTLGDAGGRQGGGLREAHYRLGLPSRYGRRVPAIVIPASRIAMPAPIVQSFPRRRESRLHSARKAP